MSEEVRIVSETGGEKGQKPAQLGTIDPLALLVLAEVSGFGAQKYEAFNYLRGYDWRLSFDALQRHMLAFWGGEDIDPESGLPHPAHAAWHALALVSFMKRNLGTDTRFRQPKPEGEWTDIGYTSMDGLAPGLQGDGKVEVKPDFEPFTATKLEPYLEALHEAIEDAGLTPPEPQDWERMLLGCTVRLMVGGEQVYVFQKPAWQIHHEVWANLDHIHSRHHGFERCHKRRFGGRCREVVYDPSYID